MLCVMLASALKDIRSALWDTYDLLGNTLCNLFALCLLRRALCIMGHRLRHSSCYTFCVMRHLYTLMHNVSGSVLEELFFLFPAKQFENPFENTSLRTLKPRGSEFFSTGSLSTPTVHRDIFLPEGQSCLHRSYVSRGSWAKLVAPRDESKIRFYFTTEPLFYPKGISCWFRQ